MFKNEAKKYSIAAQFYSIRRIYRYNKDDFNFDFYKSFKHGHKNNCQHLLFNFCKLVILKAY